MKMQEFVTQEIRNVLMDRRCGYDASRAAPCVFECELALKVYLITGEFSSIVSAWGAAKRGLVYAVSPRSEAILRLVDTLNRWTHEGLLNEGIFAENEEEVANNDNDVA